MSSDSATRKSRDLSAFSASQPQYKDNILRLLTDARAAALVSVLRYRRHYFVARAMGTNSIVADVMAHAFRQHGGQEQVHADKLAERIMQLGGDPDTNPALPIERSHLSDHHGMRLEDMVQADLTAARQAIAGYRDLVLYVGDRDPTTRHLLEQILAVEVQHADDLVDVIQDRARG